MQRLSGVLLVLAGAALGAYTYLPAPQNGAERLAEVTRISAAPDRSVAGSIAPPASTVAKAEIAKTETGAAHSADSPHIFSPATPLAPAANQIAVVPQATLPAPSGTWTAVVTSEPAAQTKKLTSSRPGDAETRAVLASDLQRELKRVGCYSGEITGAWTPSTQRAMTAFMDRVNATLPTTEPDYILLTLVKGHAAVACGAECPAGQVSAEAGRCVPQAVVAQATRKSQRAEERRIADEHKAQQQERLAAEQRAAEAQRIASAHRVADQSRVAVAQRAEDVRRIADASKAEAAKRLADARKAAVAKAQAVAVVEPEKLPWLEDSSAQAQAAQLRGQPPPGMMALSGPRNALPELPAAAAAVTPDRGPRPEIAPAQNDANADVTGTAPEITPPAPVKAQRPVVRQAALPQQGLPGTKSGPAVRRAKWSAGPLQAPVKYRSAKIVRRPSAVIVYAAPRPYRYASNYSSKGARRDQPRPGTAHYNLMQSLGGIY